MAQARERGVRITCKNLVKIARHVWSAPYLVSSVLQEARPRQASQLKPLGSSVAHDPRSVP